MYLFQIVKAKFTRRTRFVLAFLLVLTMLSLPPVIIIFVVVPAKVVPNEFVLFSPIVLCVTLLFYLGEEVVEKTFQIGTLEFTDDRLIIRTGKFYKEIYFKDIRIIKLKAGTGLGSWLQTTTTLVSIVQFDRQPTNLHVTREWFKGKSKQKKRIWNRNVDLLDLLEKNKLSTEINRTVKESECISE